ncbi:MAG: ABC transporter substrate-binding protein [Microbacteriaceae bacterium]
MHRTSRVIAAIGVTAVAASLLAGCSGDDDSTSAATAASGSAVDLSDVCPSTIVVQTDWNPEADHGQLYEMLGPDPVVDTDAKSVTGDLYSGGEPTGVKIEIRSGGPAIGYQTVSSQMYADTDITLGYVSTDEAVQYSDQLPTIAVMAENDTSPQMIMWDPTVYPDVTTIAELGDALEDGGVVRYFSGAAYMSYLTGAGILDESQIDGSYDGTPAKFVADEGISGQQGFATAEPYIYEYEVAAWDKAVAYQTINDAGYPIYPEALSVRSDDLETLSPCLTKLVPVLQQADVDYFADPDETNALIVDLVNQYNNGWVYDADVADYAVQTMKDLKIASDGDNGYVGDMDEDRVQQIIDIDTPIFTESGSTPKDGLVASDLFTNEFLDQSISLGF